MRFRTKSFRGKKKFHRKKKPLTEIGTETESKNDPETENGTENEIKTKTETD